MQAKRYAPDNVVGRPAVQGFLGRFTRRALPAVSSSLPIASADAVAFTATVSPRIILIDGSRLGELLVSHRIGVQEKDVFRVVEVDEDFFE